MAKRRRGFGKVELIVGLACIIIVLVVALMVLRAGRPESVWSPGDANQLRGIHQSMLVFAGEFDGIMPRPGLVVRQTDESGEAILGRGEEDKRRNTTAALYSLMIMQNYFRPDVVVSASDPNPNVQVHEEYNWDGYDVASGRHWDHTFQADLNRLSHASYANLFMLGERFDTYWRETAGSEVPVLGNRGPEGGKRQRSSFTTNRNGYWSGYVVAGDHSTQLQTSMTPAWLQYDDEGELKPDNLFGIDTGLHGNDVVLTFTREATGASATLHHD